jgi:hypothetical protein
MKKPVELFYFFQINDASSFKSALRNRVISLVTSTAVLISPASSQPLAYMNIAFSQRGLNALGIKDSLGDSFFSAGQLADAPGLGDNVNGDWDSAFTGSGIHGVLLIASDSQAFVNDMLNNVLSSFGSSISETTRLQGAARPGSQAGHERTYITFSFSTLKTPLLFIYLIFIPTPNLSSLLFRCDGRLY